MRPDSQSPNGHIEQYLDYYCSLPHAPGFAVLLKGPWGSGKTWFIERYRREKLEKRSQQCLYISLYGIATISDIEDKFFQLLNPLWASKGMAITGIIAKGLLKGALKIDLNNDGKDDVTWNIQIPDINLPERLKNINESILVFDDLERCNINLSNLLGYINYFVEHQDLKVLLVANEDKLFENRDCDYKSIKEKLVGKTFAVSPDFEGAVKHFITLANDEDAKSFLSSKTELIRDLYSSAEYVNLRVLRQAILDFDRIFEALPENARRNSEALESLLKFLIAFSIQIKCGATTTIDISEIQKEYTSLISTCVKDNSSTQEDSKEATPIQKILSKFKVNIYEPFPSSHWWETFFNRGVIDENELEVSISSSKYFQDNDTPDWMRLYHFSDLSDNDFDELLKKVENDYNTKIFDEIGVIKHIFGLFLFFSDAGLYAEPKSKILENAKSYIDYLRQNHHLNSLILTFYQEPVERLIGGCYNLTFQGSNFQEFKDFDSYLDNVLEAIKVDRIPDFVQSLLAAMKTDQQKFRRIVCFEESREQDMLERMYYESPILQYINEADFIEEILLMQNNDKSYFFGLLTKRYRFESINEKLIEELDWLRSIQGLLKEKASLREGKLSGYYLQQLNTEYLNNIIEKLEHKKNRNVE